MPDRPPDRDVRISIRTLPDTKRRIAKAAAHHGLSISGYMKRCTIQHMEEHGLWDLRGRVNRQDPKDAKRPRLSDINEVKDPDEQEEGRVVL